MNKRSILIWVGVLILAVSTCGPSEEELAATSLAKTAAAASPTPSPTPIPSPTPRPTATSTPIPPNPILAYNYVAEVDYDGFTITIARVLVSEKWYMVNAIGGFDEVVYDGSYLVGEIIFTIENNTSESITVYPTFGTVVVNSMRVDLSDFVLVDLVWNNTSGEYSPGSAVTGGIWFGIPGVRFNDVNRMTIAFDAPRNEDGALGEDFYVEIDLTIHPWNPLPPELRALNP